MKNGIIYLIPTYLDDSNDRDFISPIVLEVVRNTSFYLAENIRTARRFISSLEIGVDITTMHFEQLDKNTSFASVKAFLEPLPDHSQVGILSEAGLPGLADPGNVAVAYAHQNNIRVIPLPGASAIQTALICSGFNGQQFTFHGYVPIDKEQRKHFLKNLEYLAHKTGYTQIFMETPFRNNSLMEDLISLCRPTTWLSVASGLFGESEFIATYPISKWKNKVPDLHKIPTVFSIGNNN